MSEDDPGRFKTRIFQLNTNKSLEGQSQLINSIANFDIILLQEPWLGRDGLTRAISRFNVIYPTTRDREPEKTRAVTMISTRIKSDHYIQLPIDSPDVVGLDIKCGPEDWLRIINIYNDCNHDRSMRAVESLLLEEEHRRAAGIHARMIWAGDFNRHHWTWDEERNLHLFTRQNIDAAERLIEMADRYGMVMTLAKGTPTLQAHRTGNYTRVDNVWCAEEMRGSVVKCDTEPRLRPPKTDHITIVTELEINLERTEPQARKNFRAADWTRFRESLEELLGATDPPAEIQSIDEFERRRAELENAIQAVIDNDEIVPVSKPSPFCKRWWNADLAAERKAVGKLSRTSYKKRHQPNHPVHEEFRKARNHLADAIKSAKREL